LNYLSSFTTDAAGKLDVLGHDGHTLGVDGAQVGILEQTDQISLTGLLKSHLSGALEAEVSHEILYQYINLLLMLYIIRIDAFYIIKVVLKTRPIAAQAVASSRYVRYMMQFIVGS